MELVSIREGDDFIRLGQALKKAGLVDSGTEAKMEIQGGSVLVDGKVETQRGKKLYGGEVVTFAGQKMQIVK